MNSDITAAMQRGDIQRPGFYGNQELKESNDFFNDSLTEVSSTFSLFGFFGNSSGITKNVCYKYKRYYFLVDFALLTNAGAFVF
jgi:hypothetical protein